MKKNTVIITALSCTIALLAACAGNNTSSGNSTQNSKSAPESSAISEALTASESSPTENDTASEEQEKYTAMCFVNIEDKNAVINDGTHFILGTVDTVTADLTGVFDDKTSAVKAKVTIKDPILRYFNSSTEGGGSRINTELLTVEVLEK